MDDRKQANDIIYNYVINSIHLQQAEDIVEDISIA